MTETQLNELKNELREMAQDIAHYVYCSAIDGLINADSPEEALDEAMNQLRDGDFEFDVEETVRQIIEAGWSHHEALRAYENGEDEEDEESLD